MLVLRRQELENLTQVIDEENENCTIVTSTTSLYIGGNNQKIHLWWQISSPISMVDWIGMYDIDNSDPLQYLSHKSRGVVGEQIGTVEWSITRNVVGNMSRRIYFAYVDGLTGAVRARSAPISLCNRAKLLIREVSVHNYHPVGNDDNVLRISDGLRTSHHQIPTNNTNSPLKIFEHFIFHSCSRLDIKIGDVSTTINSEDIANISGDLNVSIQTSQQSSFTLIMSMAIVPIEENEDLMRIQSPEAKIFDARQVPSSSSGSSMSQASSSGSSTHIERPLPPGWEVCTDKLGRTFYIDHTKKTTTWKRPEEEPRPFLEPGKRYSMARRTVGASVYIDPIISAFTFLNRQDFVSLLHENQAALNCYNTSAVVKHILHRIRKCGESVERYEKNRDFVAFINMFADETQPLPHGWQASGKNPTIFIDHTSRRTTLLDPRLPATPSITEKKRGRSAPPVSRNNIDKNGNMLDIVNRTEEIASVVEKRMPELAPRIRKKLRLIEKMGAPALARLANDMDLMMAVSILDTDPSPVTSELEERLSYFYSSLHRSGYGKGPQKMKLRFSRTNLLRDAFDQILAADAQALRRARLSITFDDEEGLDYGGPSRELFFLLSRELFNPYYGLFEYSASDQYTVQVNSNSSFVANEMKWMELAGRVLGLALLHRCLIDTFFTRIFYKMLLEQPICLQDMELVDPEFYRGLVWVRDNPVDPSLGMTFSVTEDVNGKKSEKELLPNGSELALTDRNKEEFISLMLKWRSERGTEKQTRALLRGLHEIVDRDFLRVFTADQLELVLSGTMEINLEDWRTNTEYRGGYYDEHVVIEWFWDTVEQMSNGDRLKLLQFVTGTSSVPFEGFAMLRGSSGPKKFTIEKWGEADSLPRAHTCFNRLDLPSYPTRHVLRSKLFTAITEGIGYSIE